MVKRCQIG